MIRTFHKTIGLVFAPFYLTTALSGSILLFRKTGWISPDVKKKLVGVHNWEILKNYLGLILGAALTLSVFTGFVLSRSKNT
ncbi:MAG: hypothetical protein WA705_09795 [Candidatus Ozemobacteraceae bacterium]